jgi:light-independent protochlorophyllide reductase subunit B
VLHAPQGDTYADLLFTMIERRDSRPPVTYTTFQARDLGGDTAELFIRTLRVGAAERFKPQAIAGRCSPALPSSSRIEPGALAETVWTCRCRSFRWNCRRTHAEENWGAAETFYQTDQNDARLPVPAPGTAHAERAPRST